MNHYTKPTAHLGLATNLGHTVHTYICTYVQYVFCFPYIPLESPPVGLYAYLGNGKKYAKKSWGGTIPLPG